jgi:aspartate/methionine/tyrosine aminotransferase
MEYAPDEILATTGVAQGCFVSLMAFLNPRRRSDFAGPGLFYL